jgi:UDP-N-acetylglucosamine--N-acetylmuramyl-(pentapeptide) pyrophosphoryl-undecaprenol N-acetylglucosamine transferase
MVPLPNSIDGHQLAKAQSVVGQGAGWLLTEATVTPESFAARLAAILDDGEGLQRAAERSRSSARRDAAERLADLVAGLVPGLVSDSGEVR